MTEHASTSAPELINDNIDIHRFELTSAFDIAHALRQLMNKHDLVAIYFDHGTQFTLSTIVDVDAKGHTFTIDQSGSPEINRKLLNSERNVCVSTPEGIKYQFVCGKLREVKHNQHGALQASLPSSLIKLQRREYFRIKTPIVNPLKCRIGDHPSGKLEFALHDISLGGLCLTSATPRDDFQLMQRFMDCQLELPQFGTLRFTLEIRNHRSERQRNGNNVTYIGCQFHDLSPAQQNLLQRYITQLQKDQINRGN